MKIPDNIYIQIVCQRCDDLSGIIIQLKVKAGKKNPYYIYFPKTDVNGKTSIDINNFVGQFKDYWEMGIMDYDGTLESAKSLVEVSLFDPTWLIENKELALAWPLFKHEKTKWISREQQYEYMTSCRNQKFTYRPIYIDLDKTDHIKLKIYIKE